MENQGNKVVLAVDNEGKAVEVGDLGYLFWLVKQGKVETIVFGDITGESTNWEKQYSETTVMSSEFGK